MLETLYKNSEQYLPPITESELTDQEVLVELNELKQKLNQSTMVLGHHYQNDDIIKFADFRGDSLALARRAASEKDKEFIIFCGVHFMAETADMLTSDQQQVLLPDLNAGCSMADMANAHDVTKAWDFLKDNTTKRIVPITYINCDAKLKAFVGEHGGSICTSSNAKKIIQWAFEQGEKLLFFPDQHLGRNTCYELGIDLDEMVIYNPAHLNGGLTQEDIEKAKVILWHGHCSVHQGFNVSQIENLRKEKPHTTVIVHPECSFEVVQASDLSGSTSFIIERISEAPAGTSFAVGTEINLVNRLNQLFEDKDIFSLSPYQCLCTTMYRIRPRWLLNSFRSIDQGNPINVIQVDAETALKANLALERMLSIH